MHRSWFVPSETSDHTPVPTTVSPMHGYAPLVETTRGGRVESVHLGALVVADTERNVAWSLGDPELVSFPRSSLKPFQLLALLERGGVEHLGLSTTDLAIASASHVGQDIHLQAVTRLLEKIDAPPSALMCGVHPPADPAAAARVKAPSALHNNCSGKHAGMLALARLLGAPLDNYIDLEHPAQQAIRECLVDVLGLHEPLTVGIDGCSAPAYAVPLASMARGFALLAKPDAAPARWQSALRQVSAAMRLHPELVASTAGAIDTDLMRAAAGDVVAKGGAEGYFGVGHRRGLGLALKVVDGDPARRARPVAVAGAIERLGWAPAGSLEAYGPCRQLHNWAGRVVGEIRAAF